MDEMGRLLLLRDELVERAAALPPGALTDAVAFQIGEIDLRLRELWSGEDSGVKPVSLVPLGGLPERSNDRPGSVHRS